jgi:hypothetical protein
MDAEQKRILAEFEEMTPVYQACERLHSQPKHFAFPALIKSLHASGYLMAMEDGPIVDNIGIYTRCFLLTDKGRDAIGLNKLDAVKPVAAVKQKGLF